ncbi:type VI-B CRISPR accessory protein Csx28 [Porphyromonas gingivalis]|uniref:Uncharacterized protein n=1 Tax=Porphyromonas gingivalis F0570 TaxID=1227271 RepID=A0A0E2LP20_PORGN|nr:CRISPR-associated protein Csx28 [Porphyromonas gingivalis]AIJ36391.1 hypothetical protein EG14_10340 [Porphyromonas gingivalis]ATR94136.1 hypothetical protein CS546_03325 [Porphyromonas gingivalis]ATR97297.1 hypothetical protein CS548_09700 [Porphyromonas gingivalis]ATS04702.1 hypothetical protein CS374_06755 [Porphyromonas gingivalis]ERJ64232.1 hypothetical protein HMPREF1555_01957 [Porphyromonas gingivalis F0570]
MITMTICWTPICVQLLKLSGIFIAAYLAYRYAVRKLSKESIENIERCKYQAVLEAHRSFYKLLRFTTDTENADSILVWQKAKGGGAKTYYFRPACIRGFLSELTDEFYKNGNGIFLSKEIISRIFEYRSIVYGLLLSERQNSDERVVMNKPETAERMISIHQELTQTVREAIALKKRTLNF